MLGGLTGRSGRLCLAKLFRALDLPARLSACLSVVPLRRPLAPRNGLSGASDPPMVVPYGRHLGSLALSVHHIPSQQISR